MALQQLQMHLVHQFQAVRTTADGCFIPSMVTIDVGGEVTWENNDTAAHTVTSGTPTEGPSGVFDSSLVMAGSIIFS